MPVVALMQALKASCGAQSATWRISLTVQSAAAGILGGVVCIAVTKVITRTSVEPLFITNLDKIYPRA